MRLPVIHELSEFKTNASGFRSEIYKTLLEKGIEKEKIDVVMSEMNTMLAKHILVRLEYVKDYFGSVIKIM